MMMDDDMEKKKEKCEVSDRIVVMVDLDRCCPPPRQCAAAHQSKRLGLVCKDGRCLRK
jgi:hypothetical protein